MLGIHKQRVLLMLFATIGSVAVFFPWVKTNDGLHIIGIKSGLQSWFVLIALIGVIIVCTYGNKEKPLQGWLQYTTIALSSISVIIGIIKVLHIVGIGLILIQVCSIACVFIALNISRKKEDGIKEIEN
jgi:hypothetical protein